MCRRGASVHWALTVLLVEALTSCSGRVPQALDSAAVTKVVTQVLAGEPLSSDEQRNLRLMARSARYRSQIFAISSSDLKRNYEFLAEVALERETEKRNREMLLQGVGPLIREPTVLWRIYRESRITSRYRLAAIEQLASLGHDEAIAEVASLVVQGSSSFSRNEVWDLALRITDLRLRNAARNAATGGGPLIDRIGGASLLISLGPEENDGPLLRKLALDPPTSGLGKAGLAALGNAPALRQTVDAICRGHVPGFLGQSFPKPVVRVLKRSGTEVAALIKRKPPGDCTVYGLWMLAAINDPEGEALLTALFENQAAVDALRPNELRELVDLAAYYNLNVVPAILDRDKADKEEARYLLWHAGQCNPHFPQLLAAAKSGSPDARSVEILTEMQTTFQDRPAHLSRDCVASIFLQHDVADLEPDDLWSSSLAFKRDQ